MGIRAWVNTKLPQLSAQYWGRSYAGDSRLEHLGLQNVPNNNTKTLTMQDHEGLPSGSGLVFTISSHFSISISPVISPREVRET